ncbi:MAG TPA: hypothetical protein VF245_09825 [Solirubrobacterales bacterium]
MTSGDQAKSLKITPESAKFLVELFTDLRNNLREQMREPGEGNPRLDEANRKLDIYEALLAGLARDAAFPDDDALREYVSGLAEGVDQANKYEQVVLEHRALAELVDALSAS